MPEIYVLADVAEKMRKSERWITDFLKREGLEYMRAGNDYLFTDTQLEALFKALTRTGRKKSSPKPVLSRSRSTRRPTSTK